MIGGFDKVFDCVGSKETISEGMWFTRSGGKLIIVGLASRLKDIDLTPVWFKEIDVKGSFYYGMENFRGEIISTYQMAINLISNNKINVSPLLTHRFNIQNYKKAIDVASNKSKNNSIKVVFQF
jgi:threonine dehydrogenase-like Zn-dependent dehydrogenase